MGAQEIVYSVGVAVLSYFLLRLIRQMDENTKEVQGMRMELTLFKTELSSVKKSNLVLKKAFHAMDRHLMAKGIIIPYEVHPNELDDE